MKRALIISCVTALCFSLAIALYAADVKCPIDGSSAYFTGTTKVDPSGKLLYLYHCNQFGHEFWVPQN